MNREFRVAECLTENGVKEFAIFSDGTPKEQIQKDEQGNKYFRIANPYAPENASYKERHFYNRIKDAIFAIRDGYADAIICKDQSIGGFIQVVKFVDDAVAMEYRQKTLSGWQNTQFGFAMRAGNRNSWSGYSLIGNNGEKLGFMANTLKYKVFDTVADAEKYANELLTEAVRYASKIVEAENHEDAIDSVFDEIRNTFGNFSIVEDFVCDLLKGDGSAFKNSEHSLDEYGYDISQCIIPAREDVIENEWYAQASLIFPELENRFVQFKDWEHENVKKLIVDTFEGFYKNNPTEDFSNETTVLLKDEVQNHLFQRWLTVVRANKELLYPVA